MFEINTDNELSNFDIIKIIEDMKLSHVFGGVYSKDQLPILERNKFYIINLQDSDAGNGTHWTVFFYNKPLKSIYYDSVSNLNESRIEMLHALELNPLNCYFLLGSSVIDTKIGNFDLAQSSINKVFQLCPQMPGLPNTQKYLDDTKSQ